MNLDSKLEPRFRYSIDWNDKGELIYVVDYIVPYKSIETKVTRRFHRHSDAVEFIIKLMLMPYEN